jgi:hypothetical protein
MFESCRAHFATFAAGCAGPAPAAGRNAGEELPVRGVTSYEGFYATHDRTPGDGALRVGGTVVFCTSGWSAKLRRPEGPPRIDPFVLELELVIDPPPSDARLLQVLTPIELEELRAPDPTPKYREIHFTVVGSEDDPPGKLDVLRPQQ